MKRNNKITKFIFLFILLNVSIARERFAEIEVKEIHIGWKDNTNKNNNKLNWKRPGAKYKPAPSKDLWPIHFIKIDQKNFLYILEPFDKMVKIYKENGVFVNNIIISNVFRKGYPYAPFQIDDDNIFFIIYNGEKGKNSEIIKLNNRGEIVQTYECPIGTILNFGIDVNKNIYIITYYDSYNEIHNIYENSIEELIL